MLRGMYEISFPLNLVQTTDLGQYFIPLSSHDLSRRRVVFVPSSGRLDCVVQISKADFLFLADTRSFSYRFCSCDKEMRR